MKRHSSNNDAWLAGYLLAQGFNKIYDDGATKKGLALQDAMMNNPDPTDEDIGNAFAVERNKLMQNPTKFTDFIPQEYRINPGGNVSENSPSTFTGMIRQGYPEFNLNLGGNASDNGTPGGLTSMIPQEYRVKPAEATPDTTSGGLLSSMFPKPAEKQPQGLFAQFEKINPERANAIRVATTPDESKVRELASQQAKIRNDENFNSEEYLARLHKALIKQGLPPESVETVMKQAAAEAGVKQRGVDERRTKETVSAINKLIGEGNYEEAQLMLGQLVGSNPNTVKYFGDVVGKNIAFEREKALQDDKIKAGAYAKNPSAPFQASGGAIIDKRTGQVVGTIPQNGRGRQSGAGNSGSYSKEQIALASRRVAHAEKYAENNDGDMTNYPYKKHLQESERILDNVLFGEQQPPTFTAQQNNQSGQSRIDLGGDSWKEKILGIGKDNAFGGATPIPANQMNSHMQGFYNEMQEAVQRFGADVVRQQIESSRDKLKQRGIDPDAALALISK